MKEGYIDKNLILTTPKFRRMGRYERSKARIPSETMDRLEEAAPPALQAMLIALRETGARPIELCRARIEKCDLEAGVLLVPNKTAHTAGDTERPIILSQRLRALIRELIGDRMEGPIFRSLWGTAWTKGNLTCLFQRLKKRLGLPTAGLPLYAYRSGLASRAINETNANPAPVAELLGHSDLAMLMKHYLRTDPTALQRANEEITKKGRPRGLLRAGGGFRRRTPTHLLINSSYLL